MKVVILTTFMEFNSSYSLTGIVQDQVNMLVKHGHDVHVVVNEQFNSTNPLEPIYKFPGTLTVHPILPFTKLVDYRTIKDLSTAHEDVADKMVDNLRDLLGDADAVFTHDLIFTGWNLPYAEGIKKLSENNRGIRWMHWVHSVPTDLKDWWDIYRYGPGHKIIFPNQPDKIRVSEQFRGLPEHVYVIPHIKDPRSWWNFSRDTLDLIDENPGIMSADVVCIYPASSDRLDSKQLDVVIEILAQMKKMGASVFLLCANQWANSEPNKRRMAGYKTQAEGLDLRSGEFVYSSEVCGGKFELGLPQTVIRELFLLSNIFIFPTIEESFGLAAAEAALSGCVMVHNRNLLSQAYIHNHNGLYFDFGSSYQKVNFPDKSVYFHDVALLIRSSTKNDTSIASKTHIRQNLNMDYLYHTYYRPMIAELNLI